MTNRITIEDLNALDEVIDLAVSCLEEDEDDRKAIDRVIKLRNKLRIL